MRTSAFVPIILMLSASLVGCLDGTRSRFPTTDQSLGLEKVVIYRNGIGYFERRGEFSGHSLTIKVRKDQVNDLLKSLTVVDEEGRAVSVSMPLDPDRWSNIATAMLKPQNTEGSLASVLNSLRGVQVVLSTTEGTVSGRITMVERISEEPDPTVVARGTGGATTLGQDWKITLLSEQDFNIVRLSKVKSFELKDGDLAMQFHRSLDAASGEGMFQQVSVTIDLDDSSSHNLVVSYVVSAPIWKPTYRMVLPKGGKGEGLLQGWAVVDNTSGEDWSDVELALTSGEPSAFRYDLHTPLTIQRMDMTPLAVRKMAAVAVGEMSFGDDKDVSGEAAPESELADYKEEPMAGADMPAARPAPAPPPRSMTAKMKRESSRRGYLDLDGEDSLAAEELTTAPAIDIDSLRRSTLAQARASQVSGLMRFDIQDRVSLPDGSSTMVAIINKDVTAEEAFMFKPGGAGVGFEYNPYRVVRFRNTTGFVLEPGPIAIYSDGSFVGEGISDTISTGTSATIPFAIEQGIKLTNESKSVPEGMRLLRISRGVLILESFDRLKTTWTAKAQTDDKGYTVLIRHPRYGARYSLMDRPQGTEDLLDAYLIPLVVPPGKRSGRIEVVEQTPMEKRIWIVDAPDSAIKLLQEATIAGDLSLANKQKVEKILAVRYELGRVRSEADGLERQRRTLQDQQEQLQQSLKAIKDNTSADAAKHRAQWERDLADLLKRTQAIVLEKSGLHVKETALKKDLNDLVQNLEIEVAKPTRSAK